ncbi:hypothetical protein MB901379_04484 [Mycobacterium basiliense]|uniref:Uncharacterized protein n=1 Tax=Mycobacterium basiliense TaxID=2094119 RepID=A0A3S4BHP1_9MYCO|nr:hypothetical protein MB901379_04484 [Mycobacterium basiliense]
MLQMSSQSFSLGIPCDDVTGPSVYRQASPVVGPFLGIVANGPRRC